MTTATEADTERLEGVAALCTRLAVDPALPHLDEALTHRSYANEQPAAPGAPAADNQRLEFLGDSVLGLCVSELLMAAFSDVDEGELTMMRAALVNTVVLAGIAQSSGIDRALRMGRGAHAAGERGRANVLADALEAVIGCVYVDAGLGAARELVRALLGDQLAVLVANGGIARDAKSRLQELAQARGLPAPRYRVVAERGPDHAREFCVEVVAYVDRQPADGASERAPGGQAPEGSPDDRGRRAAIIVTGEGRTKKLAEQAAAAAALGVIGG